MTDPRARRGFAIPAAIVLLVAVAMIAGTTQWASWRAVRASRLAWDGDRALLAADEAAALAITGWTAADFAPRDIGSRWSMTRTTADGVIVTARFTRTAPLVVSIALDAHSARTGPLEARRALEATLELSPPVPPLRGALTSVVAVDGSLAVIDGTDRTVDACSATRDTLSVPPAAIDPALAPALRAFTDSVAARAAPVEVLSAPFGGGGAAWTARIVRSDSTVPSPIIVATSASHHGLLVVHGDLHVPGAMRVDGLLVVTGAIVVTGTLRVEGAALVDGAPIHSTTSSTLGAATTLRYSRCNVLRALATVATPSRAIDWRER